MVNVKNTAKAYSEVYEFINILGNDYIEMISPKVYKNIEENRDMDYKPEINVNEINEETFSKEALALIATLNLQYWCKDENEKKELMEIYQENTNKEKKALEEKYSYENIFKDSKKIEKVEIQEETETEIENNMEMVVYNENIFVSILNKIKDFIKKIFNK